MPTNVDQVTLKEEFTNIIEEARMILPGMQALFGFQMIAVFNDRFAELSPLDRWIHLSSLLAVALAIACIMTPAAYHRTAEPGTVSRFLVGLSSRCIQVATVPLMLGITGEVFLVSDIVSGNQQIAVVAASLLLLVYIVLWWVLPLSLRQRSRK